MGKLIVFTLFICFLVKLVPDSDRDYFWYPKTLYMAYCNGFTGEVYRMKNSYGIRNWPYMIEKSTKQELELSNSCSYKVLSELPEWKKGSELTEEQKQYIIEGF